MNVDFRQRLFGAHRHIGQGDRLPALFSGQIQSGINQVLRLLGHGPTLGSDSIAG